MLPITLALAAARLQQEFGATSAHHPEPRLSVLSRGRRPCEPLLLRLLLLRLLPLPLVRVVLLAAACRCSFPRRLIERADLQADHPLGRVYLWGFRSSLCSDQLSSRRQPSTIVFLVDDSSGRGRGIQCTRSRFRLSYLGDIESEAVSLLARPLKMRCAVDG